MRVSEQDRVKLKRAVRDIVGVDAATRVFGSRLDDGRRGGDLDIYVEVGTELNNPAWTAAQIVARAQHYLGERRIDVVLRDAASIELPIHRVARETGALL